MSQSTAGSACRALLRRDLILAIRHRGELANSLLFFVMVVTLFPLGLGPESSTLQVIAPGIIWVSALLAALLSLESVFRSDFEDGSLEQLLLSPHPAALLILTKVFVHWLISGLPLLLIAPLLGVLLHLPTEGMTILIASLALGTPILSLVGAIGVALTVGLRRGGVLLSLLVLPLYVPVVIYGTSAVASAAVGLPAVAQLYFLAALLALALTLAPIAAAASLRISVS